jgi:hypothetical protein
MLIEYKIWNNFPFGIKFKFETLLKLKILEIELILNFI